MLRIESAAYGGWNNNVRISNREVEAIVTGDVGPRVIRFAFKGQKNILAELPGQIGGRGEKKWMIRGGHRLWIAPEAKPRSYEPDNEPIRISVSAGRVTALQAPGPITGIQKRIELELDPDKNLLKLTHRLTNCGRKPFELSPWALTVMARRGTAIIPLPEARAPANRLPACAFLSLAAPGSSAAISSSTSRALPKCGCSTTSARDTKPTCTAWIAS